MSKLRAPRKIDPPAIADEPNQVPSEHKLRTARQVLMAATRSLAELEAARKAGTGDIAQLDADIAALKATIATESNGIKRLQFEFASETDAARGYPKAKKFTRVKSKLERSLESARKVERLVGELDVAFREMYRCREEVLPEFTGSNSHISGGMRALEGGACTAVACLALLQYELFRRGHRFNPLNGAFEPSLPGGLAPNLSMTMQPDKVPSLVQHLTRGNEFVLGLLQESLGLVPPPVEPAPVVAQPQLLPVSVHKHEEPEPAPHEPHEVREPMPAPAPVARWSLAELYARLHTLTGPNDEANYLAVLGQIRQLEEAAA